MRRFAQAIAAPESLPDGLPAGLAAALTAAPDRYNIGKGGAAIVLARCADGSLSAAEMIWGLVPRWSRQPSTPYTTVTARLDRAPKSRIYAQAWQQRPCVLAMTGYYKRDRQRRPPWPMFVQRRDGLALLVAGLWEHRGGAEGAQLDSFTILTGPNAAIPSPLTPDGPVFVEPLAALAWLAGRITTPAALAASASTPGLEAYPVSRATRDPTRDHYTLLEPVNPDDVGSTGATDAESDDVDPDADALE